MQSPEFRCESSRQSKKTGESCRFPSHPPAIQCRSWPRNHVPEIHLAYGDTRRPSPAANHVSVHRKSPQSRRYNHHRENFWLSCRSPAPSPATEPLCSCSPLPGHSIWVVFTDLFCRNSRRRRCQVAPYLLSN